MVTTKVWSPSSSIHLTLRTIPKSTIETTGTSGSATASSQFQTSFTDGKFVCIPVTIALGDRRAAGTASQLVNNRAPRYEPLVCRRFASIQSLGFAGWLRLELTALRLTKPFSIGSSRVRTVLPRWRHRAGRPCTTRRYMAKDRRSLLASGDGFRRYHHPNESPSRCCGEDDSELLSTSFH